MPLVQTPFRPAQIVQNISGSGLGTAQWTSAANAAGASDSVYATCLIANATDPSYYLRAYDFRFIDLGIPNNAIITGIYAQITRKASTTFNVKDDHIRLFTGDPVNFTGAKIYGNSLYPGTIDFWGVTNGTSVYGGTGLAGYSPLLGLSPILGSDINQSGFGFVFSCSGSVTPQTASVDSLELSFVWLSGFESNTLSLFLAADTEQSGQTDLFTQGAITITNLDGSSDGFSPSQVNGLVGWWDANISNSVFQDPITSGNSIHNQPAGLWLNQVGNNHLKQYTFAKKPTYINNNTGFLGRPYIAFDGTDDSIGMTSGITLNGDFSIWLINSLLDGDANVNNTILSATGNLLTTISQSGLQLFARSDIASGYISHGSISNTFDIRYIERNSNTITYKPNGINGLSYSVPNVSGNLTLNTLGERLNTNFYKGNIEALLIYNQRNTDAEQRNINVYLGASPIFALYTYGSIEISNGMELFLGAPELATGNPLNLYLHNTIVTSDQFDLFVGGPASLSGVMNLFLRTADLSYISTSGKRQYNPSLYVKGAPLGTGIQEGSLNLFLESSRVQAPLNLFVGVDNSVTTDTYMNLFVNGRAYDIGNSLHLYVGASGEINTLNLYTKGRGFVEVDNPFYPSDSFYPYSGGMNLFIMRDPAEMLNLFVQCQISSGGFPLYTNGAFLIDSGINLVMPSTIDSGNKRQLLFTRGGV
jgi:hypothetical protein